MKPLTIQNFLMLAILFLGLGMLTTSCEQDPCEDVTCLNGGSCEDGDCVCPDRYTGEECETDKCENVGCENGSYAINGNSCTCECVSGYEGDSCNTEIRTKFLGTYDVDDDCLSNDSDYSSTIKVSNVEVNKILIENLGNYECDGSNINFEAEMTSSTTFDIIEKDYCDGDKLSGSGKIDQATGKVTIDYTFKPAIGTNQTCTATYNLQ